MSYHYVERDLSHSQFQRSPANSEKASYGRQTYRSGDPVYSDDSSYFPPPPPPPTLDSSPRSGFSMGRDESFPPPPPPADDQHIYGNIYARDVHYRRPDGYSTPPQHYSSPGGTVSYHQPESNYANIQINVAPPTPTNKDIGFNNRFGSPPGKSQHERPIPGPMVPANSQAQVATGLSKKSNEAEVDALTDLLVKNMTAGADPEEEEKDFWGVCGRCLQTISSNTNACSALENVYHIGCFTCVGCSVPLQGKSFFAMESKPYCEDCYVNTLERCSVCSSPITDRLLRATGKPYHPDCFTCVVCGKSLDGIPFTVDATNQIHCIDDFHKKFAPRCCVCQRPIMPEPGQDETVRIVAMDKSFHVACYRCEDCKCQLSSEVEGRGCYPLDDHILCKNCNAKRIQALTTKMATDL